jgi:membrane-associated protease RseP (regulator of RpoE activity)
VSDETQEEPATPETPAAETPETPAAETPEAPAAETPAPAADAAATAPTEETAVPAAAAVTDAPPTATPETAAAPVAAAPVAATATASKTAERKTVAVPMSVLITLGAILVAALMFGIGYAVGDSGNDDSTAVQTPIGNAPQFPNQPNQGNGNNPTPNFPQLPGGNQQTPNQPNQGNGNEGNGNQQTSSPPFMGIATQQTTGGLEVTQVVAGSAAEKAGIETGDVITEFDGDAVTTSAQLANAVAQHEVGDRVEVTYTRDGETETVTLTLGTRTTSN